MESDIINSIAQISNDLTPDVLIHIEDVRDTLAALQEDIESSYLALAVECLDRAISSVESAQYALDDLTREAEGGN